MRPPEKEGELGVGEEPPSKVKKKKIAMSDREERRREKRRKRRPPENKKTLKKTKKRKKKQKRRKKNRSFSGPTHFFRKDCFLLQVNKNITPAHYLHSILFKEPENNYNQNFLTRVTCLLYLKAKSSIIGK